MWHESKFQRHLFDCKSFSQNLHLNAVIRHVKEAEIQMFTHVYIKDVANLTRTEKLWCFYLRHIWGVRVPIPQKHWRLSTLQLATFRDSRVNISLSFFPISVILELTETHWVKQLKYQRATTNQKPAKCCKGQDCFKRPKELQMSRQTHKCWIGMKSREFGSELISFMRWCVTLTTS